MKGELIFSFTERWAVWTIWQGCQVKGQDSVEHYSINRYYAFLTLNILGLITNFLQLQSL